MTRIAVLGAGHVGPVIARVAIEAGYDVSISASGDPAEIELITQVLVPGAEARWAADAVADADLVVLSIPLHKFATFDPDLVAGKLVVDTMNHPCSGRIHRSAELRGHRECLGWRAARPSAAPAWLSLVCEWLVSPVSRAQSRMAAPDGVC